MPAARQSEGRVLLRKIMPDAEELVRNLQAKLVDDSDALSEGGDLIRVT